MLIQHDTLCERHSQKHWSYLNDLLISPTRMKASFYLSKVLISIHAVLFGGAAEFV